MVVRTLILGGPGCGKTRRLLNIMEAEMAAGVPADKIAFVGFTNAAVDVATARACEAFNIDRKQLPWFRTIHSMCFVRLGLSTRDVMRPADWKVFSELLGEELGGADYAEGAPLTDRVGERMRFIVDYAANTLQTLEQAWHAINDPIDWFRLKRFHDALEAFKHDTAKMDFSDMVLRYPTFCNSVPVDVAIIDEGQDLTAAQWRAVDHAFAQAARVYIAGDDDQAIYAWSGADVQRFLTMPVDKKEVLPTSHRLPREVFNVGKSVAGRISKRYSKDFIPTDKEGRVRYAASAEELDPHDGKEWLFLARNRLYLRDFEEVLRRKGLVFALMGKSSVTDWHATAILAWEALRKGTTVSGAQARTIFEAKGGSPPRPLDSEGEYSAHDLGLTPTEIWHDAFSAIPLGVREYYLTCLRRGEKLNRRPRVVVSTIHGAKGAEADNVVLLNSMTKRTTAGYVKEPDTEHRVFYVGLTRAREELIILEDRSVNAYPI